MQALEANLSGCYIVTIEESSFYVARSNHTIIGNEYITLIMGRAQTGSIMKDGINTSDYFEYLGF